MENKKYFIEEDFQKVLERFNNTSSKAEYNKIYANEIHPILKQIASNVYWRYSKLQPDESIDNLISDCGAHLFSILNKIDTNKGKVFAYFTTSARRYFFHKEREFKKRYASNSEIDEKLMAEDQDIDFVESVNVKELTDKMRIFISNKSHSYYNKQYVRALDWIDNCDMAMSPVQFRNQLQKVLNLSPEQTRRFVTDLKKMKFYKGILLKKYVTVESVERTLREKYKPEPDAIKAILEKMEEKPIENIKLKKEKPKYTICKGDVIFTGTKKEIMLHTSMSAASAHKLIHGLQKSLHGWQLIK